MTRETAIRRYEELVNKREGMREMEIRRIAEHVASNPQTYGGGLYVPWRTTLHLPVVMHPAWYQAYVTLFIQLPSGLELSSFTAERQLLVEEQIREQLGDP